MDIHHIDVLDLYLDSENPRHEVTHDQPKIIEQLLRAGRVTKLAQDIARNGISPFDILGVMEDDNGNYLVLEGNRRICALMLLNDPELAPPGERSFFEKLAAAADVPQTVPCVIFETREEVRVWLERRHNGPQDGVGLVSWDSTQKSRFFRGSNTMTSAVLDYAVSKGILTKEKRNKISLTTASRYLNNPIVRHTFGITSGRTDPKVEIDVEVDEFDKALGKFCSDLENGENGVSSRTKKKDWEAYAKKLKAEGWTPTKHVDPYPLGSAPSSGKADQAGGKAGKRNNPSADKRRTLIPASCKVVIKNKNLKRIYEELRNLDCNTFPFAAAVVCRAFLEDTYHRFYEAQTGKQHRAKAHIVLESCIKLLEKDIDTFDRQTKQALKAIRKLASDPNNTLSAANLGNVAHATYAPDPKQLKREWDNIEAIILVMLERS